MENFPANDMRGTALHIGLCNKHKMQLIRFAECKKRGFARHVVFWFFGPSGGLTFAPREAAAPDAAFLSFKYSSRNASLCGLIALR